MKLFIIAMITLLLGLVGMGIMHEQVHVQIYKSYGVDSHVEYFSHFPDLVTFTDEPCPTAECTLANNMNEVVGYPLMVFYCIFGSLFVMLILLVELYLEEISRKLD